MAGYSPNPLAKKLGIKEGFIIKTLNTPADYLHWLAPLPADISINKATDNFDFIHLFTNSREELEQQLSALKNEIKKSGMIWVSWYKKSAKKPTEIDENALRDTALTLGLVDVKVCAVTDEWSGLKLVYRLKDR